MNTKRLITASIFALISASAAQAADVTVPHQSTPVASSAFVVPNFTWAGFYLGGQVGGLSSKTDISIVGKDKSIPLSKDFSPKLSGFEGGLYVGSNIDLGDNFIFGIDTDLIWSGQKHTKTITIGESNNAEIDNLVARSRRSARSASGVSGGVGGVPRSVSLSPQKAATDAAQASTKPEVPAKPAAAKPATPEQTAAAKLAAPAKSAPEQTAASEGSVRGTAVLPVKSTPAPATEQRAAPKQMGASEASVGKITHLAGKSTSVEAGVSTGTSLGRSASVSSLAQTPPTKPAAAKPADSAAPVSGGAERSPLTLARSAPVENSTQTSLEKPAQAEHANSGGNRVSHSLSRGASNGAGHSSHPHGAPHRVGHGAGTNSHGANPHSVGANPRASNPHGNSHGTNSAAGRSAQASDKNANSVYGVEQMRKVVSELGLERDSEVETLSHTLKQNWSGATRVRIGFAADRFMPYVAGGIAYVQLQDTVSISLKKEDGRVVSSKNLTDETKTMIGYTVGGGVDFAMLDNVIVRAEYRYSDFGKKKFAKEKIEMKYTTNDFRVGVAYKF
ncbi:outer membrane beta-barrel protein [Bartonella vinsonii]|uniref:Opacity protein and related surface antigens n=1 Tax=Bartonella vinsonii TaxID=33047 RepID=A0A448V4Z8_BARVI|nr:outer membrane beta-barrel protein [Bartonella vinsonii]VEJ44855.1 Opacity protein and related surface antigens [Bartonella vinsonii]